MSGVYLLPPALPVPSYLRLRLPTTKIKGLEKADFTRFNNYCDPSPSFIKINLHEIIQMTGDIGTERHLLLVLVLALVLQLFRGLAIAGEVC